MAIQRSPWRVLVLISILFFTNSCADHSQNIEKQAPIKEASMGLELYSLHCTSCHGDDGSLGASGAKDLTKSTLNKSEIEFIIRAGKNAMPSFEAVFDTEQKFDSIAEYVLRLK